MKNASVVIALIVGMVIGLVMGRMTVESGSDAEDALAEAGDSNVIPLPPTIVPTPTVAARAPAGSTVKVPLGDAHFKGNANALVTIIEFSDFQCPFCSRVNPTIKQIQDTYGDKVRIAFKHNPLSFHADAPLAAEASEAAGAQGKFWEYHDKLFANQRAIKRPDLERYADELGLDSAKFKAALDQGTYKAKVAAHTKQAQALGATGTPGFFINGKFLRGAQPFPKFKEIIDAELINAEALLKKGVKPAALYAEVIKNGAGSVQRAAPKQARPAKSQFAKVQVGDAHFKGAKDAKVTIIEWSDFQCPFCGRVGPALKQIEEEYGDSVRVAFKHQPLPFHADADLAAQASEAAGAQGKFWEFHDKLFANQKALKRPQLEQYAQEIGLNLAKFKSDLDSGAYAAKVKKHSAEGRTVGANGTPTFFINGRRLSGAQPFPRFKTIIDEEIAKADKLLSSGTSKSQLYAKQLADNEKQYGGSAPTAAAPAVPAAKVNIAIGKSPIKGSPNAPVTIIEFSDFQCPFCVRVKPALAQIEKEYPGKVKIVFKHQPLAFHAQAPKAAEASLAAHAQGKFWEYHDKLFANQKALNIPDLERYAQELGLDVKRFNRELSSGKYAADVKADMAIASQVGASGTPTFFINGRKLVGAQPFDRFKTIIDEELKGGARAAN